MNGTSNVAAVNFRIEIELNADSSIRVTKLDLNFEILLGKINFRTSVAPWKFHYLIGNITLDITLDSLLADVQLSDVSKLIAVSPSSFFYSS